MILNNKCHVFLVPSTSEKCHQTLLIRHISLLVSSSFTVYILFITIKCCLLNVFCDFSAVRSWSFESQQILLILLCLYITQQACSTVPLGTWGIENPCEQAHTASVPLGKKQVDFQNCFSYFLSFWKCGKGHSSSCTHWPPLGISLGWHFHALLHLDLLSKPAGNAHLSL